MNYGRALKIARAIVGIQQKILAQRAGVDPSHVSLIEKGARQPSLGTLQRLADGLGVPFHVLTLLAADANEVNHLTPAQVESLAKTLVQVILESGEIESSDRQTEGSSGDEVAAKSRIQNRHIARRA